MTIMTNDKMMAQISGRDGFIAALDQSGGSTPGALRLYGIPDGAYSGDAEMFRLEGIVRWLDAADTRLRLHPAPDPAGSIHASARDLSKFLRLQLNGGLTAGGRSPSCACARWWAPAGPAARSQAASPGLV